MSDNRKRALADVVTVEAWHKELNQNSSKADLHADVVFGIARVGGEVESQVRFRLSVRRAEVVVVIPPFEPVSVDIESISRNVPKRKGRLTEIIEHSNQTNAKGSLGASVSLSSLSARASAEATARKNVSISKKFTSSGEVQLMLVTQSKTSDGYYRWSIQPTVDDVLEGRPWDPARQPRLKLVDERKDRSLGIPPSVRVEVRCRREDLNIEDLEIKNESLWGSVQARVGFKNRIAAAECYIRDRLLSEGLEVNCIHDIFGTLTLASVISEVTAR